MLKHVLAGLALLLATFSFAQQRDQGTGIAPGEEARAEEKPQFLVENGVGILMLDSIFSLNFRFRMQSRALYFTRSETDWGMSRAEARIRRLRLRFQGFMLDPRLQYYIQLSFSRGDMDWRGRDMSAINESPNLVRDAVIFYQPSEKITFLFGQTKLPGNRQRVVSSGELQFYDRSIVNATFNIDRDFGVQAYYHNHTGSFYYSLKGALTTGDGRNVTTTPPGLAYTGRIELMPLGLFLASDPILGGGYFEGDLMREETPKLAIAGGLSYNDQARRRGSQIGLDLFEPRNITTYFIDVLLKYNGFAFYSEYMERASNNPITTGPNDATRHIITGKGFLLQSSYLFSNNFEIAGRYATVIPNREIRALQLTEEVYTLGMTRYLRKHRVKLQGNISYQSNINPIQNLTKNNWMVGFQIEMGI
jgi:phosphate-selective porin OprO and OprP